MSQTKHKGVGQGKGGGQPPKYKNKKKLEEALERYFKSLKPNRNFISWSMPEKAGACVYLKISRETWNQYRKKFPDIIKAAENRMESAWVQRLSQPAATGAIFYLKNAFREEYKDRHEVTTKGLTDDDLKDFRD